MSVEIKFIKPDIESMTFIADNMKQGDIDEVWLSHHKSPMESLLTGFNAPGYSVIVTVNNEPCAMFGLVVNDVLSGVGTPWLLSTEKALVYKRYFLKYVPMAIDDMLNVCHTLYNYVHIKNSTSIQWLKRVGFKFEEPKPYGIEKAMFHKFYIERV